MKLGEPSEAYLADEARRTLPRMLMGSSAEMRLTAARWLPAHTAEDSRPPDLVGETPYTTRVNMTTVPPYYSRDAVGHSRSCLLREEIVLGEDVPNPIRDEETGWWWDIDRMGNRGDVFVAQLLEDAIGEAGGSYILVDHTTRREGADLSPEDRPFWVHIRAREVINPENTIVVSGRRVPYVWQVLRQEFRRDSEFGGATEETLMVLRRKGAVGNLQQYASIETYRKVKNAQTGEMEWVPDRAQLPMEPHEEIPIVALSLRQIGPYRYRPPFEQLADLVLAYMRLESDYRMTQFRTSIAVLDRTGTPKEQAAENVVMGAGMILCGGVSGSKASWLEPPNLGEIRAELQRLEQEIRRQANDPLVGRVADPSATGRWIDYETAQTEVQAWAVMLRDCLETALELTAKYAGHESGGTVKVPSAKARQVIDDGKAGRALDLLAEIGVSAEQRLAEAKALGLFSEDFDVAKAIESIGTDGIGQTGNILQVVRAVLAHVRAGVPDEEAIDRALTGDTQVEDANGEDMTADAVS